MAQVDSTLERTNVRVEFSMQQVRKQVFKVDLEHFAGTAKRALASIEDPVARALHEEFLEAAYGNLEASFAHLNR